MGSDHLPSRKLGASLGWALGVWALGGWARGWARAVGSGQRSTDDLLLMLLLPLLLLVVVVLLLLLSLLLLFLPMLSLLERDGST